MKTRKQKTDHVCLFMILTFSSYMPSVTSLRWVWFNNPAQCSIDWWALCSEEMRQQSALKIEPSSLNKLNDFWLFEFTELKPERKPNSLCSGPANRESVWVSILRSNVNSLEYRISQLLSRSLVVAVEHPFWSLSARCLSTSLLKSPVVSPWCLTQLLSLCRSIWEDGHRCWVSV